MRFISKKFKTYIILPYTAYFPASPSRPNIPWCRTSQFSRHSSARKTPASLKSVPSFVDKFGHAIQLKEVYLEFQTRIRYNEFHSGHYTEDGYSSSQSVCGLHHEDMECVRFLRMGTLSSFRGESFDRNQSVDVARSGRIFACSSMKSWLENWSLHWHGKRVFINDVRGLTSF